MAAVDLIPWKPGQSGNPAGRPKNVPLVTPAIRRLSMMPIQKLRAVMIAIAETGEVPDGFTVAEALALKHVFEGLKDGPDGARARESIIERLDGKSDIAIDVSVGVLVRYVVGGEQE